MVKSGSKSQKSCNPIDRVKDVGRRSRSESISRMSDVGSVRSETSTSTIRGSL